MIRRKNGKFLKQERSLILTCLFKLVNFWFRDIESKIDNKKKLLYQVTRKFDHTERIYRENISMWERSGQWELKRQARTAKDEARKRMTKIKKESDALYQKNGPYHHVINYNSSEGKFFLIFKAIYSIFSPKTK